jgi:two-component system, NtrC family, sensor kinase
MTATNPTQQIGNPPHIVGATGNTAVPWIGIMSDQQNERVEAALEHAQRETAELATLLDTLHANAPIGLGFIDREMRIVRLNAALAAVNGAPVEDHLGKLLSDVIPDIWPQVQPLYRQVLDTGAPVVNREITARTTSDPGDPHHWLASYYPVPLDGDIIGVGVVVVDITERKQAHEFRAVVMDNMAEGLYTLDAQGRVTYLNAAVR